MCWNLVFNMHYRFQHVLKFSKCFFKMLSTHFKHNKEASRLYAELCEFEKCFWLFIDVDIFFMCKMFLSFSTDVYVIFCYWNISMKWMDFIFICHLLMLTYFLCGKYLQFQYCFWLFTDVHIFFMCKMFLSFSTDVYVIFCYWNISIKCTHFMLICHLLMLTYFFMWKIF